MNGIGVVWKLLESGRMNSASNNCKKPVGAERPFPWRCQHCFKTEVALATVRYNAEIRHEGRLHAFTIPDLRVPACRACGEKVFTEQVDEQISAALHKHLQFSRQKEMKKSSE